MFKPDKNILVLLGGRIIQSFLAVVSIRLLTGMLSQEEVGHQYLINSILLWFSLVLINPVGMYTNRHLHEWKENRQLYSYFRQLNRYFIIVAVCSLPIIWLVRESFKIGDFLPFSDLAVFAMFYLFFSTWFQTMVSAFNLLDLQKKFVFLNILSQGLGLTMAFAGVHFYKAEAVVWMAGLLLGQMAGLFAAALMFRNKYPKSEFNNQSHLAELIFSKATLKFCYPIAITTLFMWFMNQGYRLVVDRHLGAENLGAIGVGLGLAASLAGVVESLATQYFYPGFYAALANSNLKQRSDAWEILWKKSIAVYIPCAFLVVGVAAAVVKVLTAPAFHHVVPFVIFGAFIEMFRQLSNIAYLVSHAEKKTHNTIAPYLVGALVLAVLFSIRIFWFELTLISVLWSLVTAAVLTYAFNMIVVNKLTKIRFDFKVPLKAIGLSAPLLLGAFLLNSQSDLWLLLACAFVSGIWALGVIVYLIKKIN